ncbi:MAG: NYN domain-containing protein, partial [Nocardioides sp.]|uniref:NYN domain-containing protein n=1 Tax=Nocardioides sp. TaxID=35761 RepID=UPI0039E4FB02
AERAPGERLETELAGAAGGTGEHGAVGGAGRVTSAAHLEQYLAMPRVRLIIDGYNVSKAWWASSPLEAQRIRLLQSIAPLVARTGAETTVVFDAAGTTTRPVAAAPRGVKVVFSPVGVIADDVIRDLVAAEPVGRVVLVVTDDQEIIGDVRRDGARAVPVAALRGLL